MLLDNQYDLSCCICHNVIFSHVRSACLLYCVTHILKTIYDHSRHHVVFVITFSIDMHCMYIVLCNSDIENNIYMYDILPCWTCHNVLFSLYS